MKKIEIFLASSIVEFEKFRVKMGALVNKLNNITIDDGIIIKMFKCEGYSQALSLKGKQGEYDDFIKQSELFVAVLGEKVGDYTLHEMDIAKECNAENGSKSLYFISKGLDFSYENENSKTIIYDNEVQIEKEFLKYICENLINQKIEIFDNYVLLNDKNKINL